MCVHIQHTNHDIIHTLHVCTCSMSCGTCAHTTCSPECSTDVHVHKLIYTCVHMYYVCSTCTFMYVYTHTTYIHTCTCI